MRTVVIVVVSSIVVEPVVIELVVLALATTLPDISQISIILAVNACKVGYMRALWDIIAH